MLLNFLFGAFTGSHLVMNDVNEKQKVKFLKIFFWSHKAGYFLVNTFKWRKHKVFLKKHFTISFQSLFPLPLLYIFAGIILGCLLLGICIYLIFKRYRAKIQPKLKDCHSVESNRRDSKDLQSKSNKNLQRAKAKAKLKPKVKGRVVRQSLEFWYRDSAFP